MQKPPLVFYYGYGEEEEKKKEDYLKAAWSRQGKLVKSGVWLWASGGTAVFWSGSVTMIKLETA